MPVAPSSMSMVLGPPQHSPDRLDFGEVWDGQSVFKTFTVIAASSGQILADIPPGPFYVSHIRELTPAKTSSKNTPMPSQISMTQQTVGQATFSEGQGGPHAYSVTSAGNSIAIDVVFKPHFDISTMMAGPKSATMKVSGPGATSVPWTLSVPLNGMFDGKHTMPVVILPQKEFLSIADPLEHVKNFVVRLVAAGEAVTGNIVWPSASPGLKLVPQGPFKLGASETKEITVAVDGTGGHTDTNPLDGTVAFQFVRQGESTPQQTPPVAFRVTFVPQYYEPKLNKVHCGVNDVTAGIRLSAKGDFDFSAWVCCFDRETNFEIFFPEAGRILAHTNCAGDLNKPIPVRVEENGPTKNATPQTRSNFALSTHYDPGSPDSLTRFRALLHSSAQLRCY